MLIEFAVSGILQAAQLADRPALAFETTGSPAVTADCVVEALRGRRLGFNIFTLRPRVSRVFDGFVVQIGEDIRVTIEPRSDGAAVRLYTDRFVHALSEAISACEISPSVSSTPQS